MPTNLVASVTKILTPELLARIASGLGLDQAALEKGTAASVPALLAALVSLVAKPGGPAKLSDAVAQQQSGILTSIANVIGESGQKELIDTGLSKLSSLVGSSTVSALTSAVSKYAGIGEGGSNDLMGLLGPLLMGVLGQQQRASGLDASGLAQLLNSQKDNIVRALPSGFAKYLSGTGILDRVTGPTIQQRTPPEQSQLGWLLPALALIAVGAIAWYLFSRAPMETVTKLPPSQAEAPVHGPSVVRFIVTLDEAKNWIGRPVYSNDGKKVGEIIELKRDPDNRVTDVFVDTGTFLGIGANRYHVTSEQVQEVKPDGLVLTLKESEVKSVPQTAGEKQQQ